MERSFPSVKTTMSRRNWITASIAGIVLVLGLAYAGSPWILASVVKQNLATWGLVDVQVRAGYPGWRTLRLPTIQFTLKAANQEIACQLNDVQIAYHPAEVIAGNLERIRVPGATMHVLPAASREQGANEPFAGASEAQSVAALLTGQWMSEVPVREVLLEKISVDGRTPSAAAYKATLRGSIIDIEATLNGTVELPAVQHSRLALSVTARKTGEAHLSLSPAANVAQPILEWTTDKVEVDQRPSRVAGSLYVNLDAGLSTLQPWFAAGANWISQIEGRLDARWQATLPAGLSGNAVGLSLQQVKANGRYKNVVLTGLSADAELAFDGGVRTTKDTRIRAEQLHVGLPIRNIDLRFALAPRANTRVPVVRFKSAGAELLGGRVRSEPFTLDFAKATNRFVVQLEGIGLHDILELERQEGLQGTGVLDGELPVEITRAGIQVAQGKLSARAPGGEIQYRPTERVGAMVKSSPNLKLVFDALSSFQYQKLEATARYQPDGNLGLQVRLEGNNPGWQQGQPVHLNLNVEENIPALLRSLQLGGEIGERVRKHYQETR